MQLATKIFVNVISGMCLSYTDKISLLEELVCRGMSHGLLLDALKHLVLFSFRGVLVDLCRSISSVW